MYSYARDTAFGQLVRALTGSKVFPYPEERSGFNLDQYLQHDASDHDTNASKEDLDDDKHTQDGVDDEEKHQQAPPAHNGEQRQEQPSNIVTWTSDSDPENPHNWPAAKKFFAFALVCLLTFTVYSGASIITPAEQVLAEEFGLSDQVSLLVLSMYVLGYGTGPLLFSPSSEIPILGRNIPYFVSFGCFLVVTLAGALVNNYPGLVVCRFLQGFFGGPVLSTGAASAGDIFQFWKLPYALAVWAVVAFGGPAVGPVIATFAVNEVTWRWAMWETLILAGFTFVVMFFFMPETNPETILLWRATRLRKLTGRQDLRSESEIRSQDQKLLVLVAKYTLTPWKTIFRDPSIAFTNLYTALIYGIYYSWFESFPIVFSQIHGFSVNGTSLVFIAVLIGGILGCVLYCAAVYFVYEPYTLKNGIGVQEHRLIPGLFGSVLTPIGVFIFGWTAYSDISWVVPCIGVVLFAGSAFAIVQCIFLYLPTSFPRHAASILTGNGFLRSALACGAIHFSDPMFHNLGVGRGNSILGGILCGCAIAFFALWYFGATLRAKSRFAETH